MTTSVKNLVELANDLKFRSGSSMFALMDKVLQNQIEVCSKDFTSVTKLVEKMAAIWADTKIENGNEIRYRYWFYSTGSCSLTLNLKNKDLSHRLMTLFSPFMKEAADSDMNPQPIRPICYQAD
jgi:polyhydroxyalkanoate synthesis regulator protein